MGKSSGPRTPKGKVRSSQNAARHWIESRRILPSEQKEAAFLRAGFTEDFKPEGLMENEIINDMVFNRLVKRRIDKANTREFAKAGEMKLLAALENQERTGSQYWLRALNLPVGEGAQAQPYVCLAKLGCLRDRIKERGPLPDVDLPELRRLYGGEPSEFGAALMSRIEDFAQRACEHAAEKDDQESSQRIMLEIIEDEIEQQEMRLTFRANLNDIELNAELQEPAAPVLETLLRYQSANSREFRDSLINLDTVRKLRR